MDKLTELLEKLGSDAKLAKEYEKNPQKVIRDAGLTDEEVKLLEEGNLEALQKATGLGSLKKIVLIIRSPK